MLKIENENAEIQKDCKRASHNDRIYYKQLIASQQHWNNTVISCLLQSMFHMFCMTAYTMNHNLPKQVNGNFKTWTPVFKVRESSEHDW